MFGQIASMVCWSPVCCQYWPASAMNNGVESMDP